MSKRTKLILGITLGVVIILGGTLFTLSKFGVINLGIFADIASRGDKPSEYGGGIAGSVQGVASSNRFLKKYSGGISRSYFITRNDGTRFEANFNLRDVDDSSNYSFNPKTKIELTAEIGLLERPATGNMYESGKFWLQIVAEDRSSRCLDDSSIGIKEVGFENVLKGKTMSQGGSYYVKIFDLIMPKMKCQEKRLDIHYLYHAQSYYISLPLARYDLRPIYLDNRSAGPYVPPGPDFPPFAIYPRDLTGPSTCPSLLPVSSEPGTISWTINPGWNTIVVPGDLVDIDTSAFFKEKNLAIYDYNFNTYLGWHKATSKDHSDLTSLHRRRGYLVASTFKCPINVTAKAAGDIKDPKVVLRRGWNLLANSKEKDVKFAEMGFRVVLQNLGGKCNSSNENSQECQSYKECSSNFGTCSEQKSMAELFKPNSGSVYAADKTRAWKNIYIYPLNTFPSFSSVYGLGSSSSNDNYKVTVTQSNLNEVVISANSVFWFYLSE